MHARTGRLADSPVEPGMEFWQDTLMNPHTPEAWQGNLFDEPAETRPQGLRYENGFLSVDEEASLISAITALPLREMRYKAYTARRRVVSYGASYDFDEGMLRPSGPPPAFLKALGAKAAAWAGLPAKDFTQILVAEYQPGTPLGWHRDVPDFEDIVGVSLASAALLRFRPYPPVQPSRADLIKLRAEPRSIYLLRGPARWEWQHSVAPTTALRYSVTFRTPARRKPVR